MKLFTTKCNSRPTYYFSAFYLHCVYFCINCRFMYLFLFLAFLIRILCTVLCMYVRYVCTYVMYSIIYVSGIVLYTPIYLFLLALLHFNLYYLSLYFRKFFFTSAVTVYVCTYTFHMVCETACTPFFTFKPFIWSP